MQYSGQSSNAQRCLKVIKPSTLNSNSKWPTTLCNLHFLPNTNPWQVATNDTSHFPLFSYAFQLSKYVFLSKVGKRWATIFLKLLIPSAKLLRDRIEGQKGHGEGNVRARTNQPKKNQVPTTKVEQGEINQRQIKFQLQK